MSKLHHLLEHTCLATESAISFPNILLCPGIHCIVICLLGPLKLNLRKFRHVDFPSRAVRKYWESMNTSTEEFCDPFVNSTPLPPSLSYRISEAGTSSSPQTKFILHNLAQPSSIKLPDAEPDVVLIRNAYPSINKIWSHWSTKKPAPTNTRLAPIIVQAGF